MAIEYRWAENQIDRLPALAAELVRRSVAVIVADRHGCRIRGQGRNHDDPDRLRRRRRPGQARSCRQPCSAGRQPDRHQSFHDGVGGKAARAPARAGARQSLALPCSSTRPLPTTETTLRDVEAAARAIGLQIQVFNASTAARSMRPSLRLCASGPTHSSSAPSPVFQQPPRANRQLAARHSIPAMFIGCVNIAASRRADELRSRHYRMRYRQVGVYVGRILKGAKPADLPVVAADQVRAGHQPQDREGARPRGAAVAARPRRRGDRMRRREFITLLGGAAAAWPLAARAQQPAMPAHRLSSAARRCRGSAHLVAAFRQGLRELGYVEGQQRRHRISLGERPVRPAAGAGGRAGRSCSVDVIVASAQPVAALGSQGGDDDHPDRLRMGGDPVSAGLVASLTGRAATSPGSTCSRPSWAAKRLDLLHELLPSAAPRRRAASIRPIPADALLVAGHARQAARHSASTLQSLDSASNEGEIERGL